MKNKIQQKKYFKYFLVSLVALIVVPIIIGLIFSDDSTKNKEEKLSYKILEQSIYAPNGEKFLIMLPKDSSKEYVQQVTEEILREYKGEADELSWLFWDNQRTFDTNMGVNVGTAKWDGDEITYRWMENERVESVIQPTEEELEIFDYYWAVFEEPGNPRGYVSHPTVVDEGYTNDWEIERVDRITSKYGISRDELFEIVTKVMSSQ